MNLYPLRLEPQVKEVVWGGSWLAEELGRTTDLALKLGESWEAFSGSKIANGPLAGRAHTAVTAVCGTRRPRSSPSSSVTQSAKTRWVGVVRLSSTRVA